MAEAPPAPPPRPLEYPTALSESAIWRLQRAWFEQEGARAWSTGTVPHMITSNAVVGGSYARVVAAFLREWRERAGAAPTRPAYVIELGSGSGRLGYHLVSRLVKRLEATPVLRDLPVTYVMTDLASRTIEGLRRHERLRPHVEAGRLDFALLDAAAPGPVRLLESGAVLAPGTLDAPVVVVANYVLDSLPQDAFCVVGGEPMEHLAAAHALPGADPRNLASLDDFEIEWTRRRMATGPRYGDPDIDGLFWEISSGGPDRSIIFPIVALRCLRNLQSFTTEPLLLLSADKGYGAAPAALSLDGPHLARHGCVSFMVDYAVLAADARRRGGIGLLPQRPAHLTVGCFLYDPGRRPWPDVQLAYEDCIARFGPDDFFTINLLMEHAVAEAELEQVVAWLRTAEWDGAIFRHVYDRLVELVTTVGTDPGLSHALDQVEASYFPIGEDHDLPQQLGILRWHMGDHEACLRLLRWSERLHGPNVDRWLGQALCLMAMGEVEEAFTPARRAASGEDAPPIAVELYQFLWQRQDQPHHLTAAEWSEAVAGFG